MTSGKLGHDTVFLDIALPIGKTRRTSRIPELDGIRVLTIAFVLLEHLRFGRLTSGFLGVGIFFVLSGYLSTMLPTRVIAGTGAIDLGAF